MATRLYVKQRKEVGGIGILCCRRRHPHVAEGMFTKSVALFQLVMFIASTGLLPLVVGQTFNVQQCKNAATLSPALRNLSVVTAMHAAGISNAAMCMKALADQLVWPWAGRICSSALNSLELMRNASDMCDLSESALSSYIRAQLRNCRCVGGDQAESGLATTSAARCLLEVLQSGIVQKLRELHQQVNLSGCNDSSLAHAKRHLEVLQQTAPMWSVAVAAAFLSGLEQNLMQSAKPSSSAADSFLLVCDLLFPLCTADGDESLAPCTRSCHLASGTAKAVDVFINNTKVPLFDLLHEAAKGCGPVGEVPCVSPLNASSYTLINNSASAATKATGGFCFTSECKFPLLATQNPKHWNGDVQTAAMSIHGGVFLAYGNLTLPYSGYFLPCGRKCTSVGFSNTAQEASRILMSVFSTIASVMVVLAIIVFYFNRKHLGNIFLRRILLVFNICGGLAACVFVPAAYGDLDNLLCYPDKTLLTHEPGSNGRCGFAAWLTYFFVLAAVGLFCVLSLGWSKLLLVIDKPGAIRAPTSIDTFWTKYGADVLSIAMATAPALIMSIIVVSLQGFDGVPLYGICTLSVERGIFTNYYIWYYVVGLGVAGMFFIWGIRRLLILRNGVRGTLMWLKGRGQTLSVKSKEGGPSQLKANLVQTKNERVQREFNQLAWQIFIYILVAAFNVTFTVTHGIYSEIKRSDWTAMTNAHIQCVLTSCEPSLCPPLPSPPAPVFILSLLVSFISVTALASWALELRFLANVPYVNRLVRLWQEKRGMVPIGASTNSSSDGRFRSTTPDRKPAVATNRSHHSSSLSTQRTDQTLVTLSRLTPLANGSLDGLNGSLSQFNVSERSTTPLPAHSAASSSRSTPVDSGHIVVQQSNV